MTATYRDELYLAIAYTIGKYLQTALLVTSIMVASGWIADKSRGLYFDRFEAVSLAAFVILFNYIVELSCHQRRIFAVNMLCERQLCKTKKTKIQGILPAGDWVLVAIAASYDPNMITMT